MLLNPPVGDHRNAVPSRLPVTTLRLFSPVTSIRHADLLQSSISTRWLALFHRTKTLGRHHQFGSHPSKPSTSPTSLIATTQPQSDRTGMRVRPVSRFQRNGSAELPKRVPPMA